MMIPEGSDNTLHPACRSILIRMFFGFRALLRTFYPSLFSSSSFLRYRFSRRVASRSKTWYLMQTRR
jgi:hypothetical protein